ncbi:hypothetical protein DSO57_1003659 [Entomophthora muscae]|uniref:Uncharacterized protein n=1 Tax=Entomophthora muscae TaxID=34485 RepID=A0ACC2T8D1_9FUNG|nr:hypothetical protein DSO57_1003659 [Entomophthora muscae]
MTNSSNPEPVGSLYSTDFLCQMASQNIPFFSGPDPQPWINRFELFCKQFCIPDSEQVKEVQYYLDSCTATWHNALKQPVTWTEWKNLVYDHFRGGVEAMITNLRALRQSKFQSTDKFVEELATLINQYEDMVYEPVEPYEGKQAPQTFEETHSLDFVFETLTTDYYKFVESHTPRNLDEAYELVCQYGKFKTRGQLYQAVPIFKPKPEQKAIMPPPADELSESMKKLAQGMANMTTYLAGDKQPQSNLTCNNCTRDGHVASTCCQKCNHCGDKNHPYLVCPKWIKETTEKLNASKAKLAKKSSESTSKKDKSFLVETMAAVCSNVLQKHWLSHIVHPYNVDGKTKQNHNSFNKAEARNNQSDVNNKKVILGSTERQPTLEIRSSNESKPREDNQASKHLYSNVNSSNVDDHSTATNPKPYGIPMDEEGGSFPEINVFKETVKTDVKKTKSKRQIIPSTEKNRKVGAWKLLKETIIPTPLIDLLGSSPSFCADMIQAIELSKFKTSDDVMASILNLKTNSSNSKNEMGKPLSSVLNEGASRVEGKVEGIPASIILDRGSTSKIITERFLRSIGVQEYSKSSEAFTFANGKTEECLGVVIDLLRTYKEFV